MRSFQKFAAQGEIFIRRIGDVPSTKKAKEGYTKLPLENGKLVIGHSETGHHHVLAHNDGADVTVLDRPPEGMRILHAILESANSLEHKRDYDTHEAIELPPGEYEFRIAREYDPYAELARISAD